MSLLENIKIKKNSLQKNSVVYIPTGTASFPTEASLYTLLSGINKGEFVLEAVLILPIFMITLMTLISFIGIYSLQTTKLTETCQNAKRLGTYAATADTLTETITIPNIYRFSLWNSVLPIKNLYMENHVTVRCWIGEYADEEEAPEEKMVYVTENGEVFHSRDCSYLQSKVETELYTNLGILRNQNGEKYSACKKCADQGVGGIIYITANGNRYHGSISCSSLSHVVIMMKYSEAIKEKRPCSKCGGGINDY